VSKQLTRNTAVHAWFVAGCSLTLGMAVEKACLPLQQGRAPGCCSQRGDRVGPSDLHRSDGQSMGEHQDASVMEVQCPMLLRKNKRRARRGIGQRSRTADCVR
jgi:hypothetical protein